MDDTSIIRVLAGAPSLGLPPEPTSARAARAFVRQHLQGADDDLLSSAELLASELVTNGVLHARSTLTLGVVASDKVVLIGVSDDAAGRPSERMPSLTAESGRGVALIAKIAKHWGVTPRDHGKITWCLIESDSHR